MLMHGMAQVGASSDARFGARCTGLFLTWGNRVAEKLLDQVLAQVWRKLGASLAQAISTMPRHASQISADFVSISEGFDDFW